MGTLRSVVYPLSPKHTKLCVMEMHDFSSNSWKPPALLHMLFTWHERVTVLHVLDVQPNFCMNAAVLQKLFPVAQWPSAAPAREAEELHAIGEVALLMFRCPYEAQCGNLWQRHF